MVNTTWRRDQPVEPVDELVYGNARCSFVFWWLLHQPSIQYWLPPPALFLAKAVVATLPPFSVTDNLWNKVPSHSLPAMWTPKPLKPMKYFMNKSLYQVLSSTGWACAFTCLHMRDSCHREGNCLKVIRGKKATRTSSWLDRVTLRDIYGELGLFSVCDITKQHQGIEESLLQRKATRGDLLVTYGVGMMDLPWINIYLYWYHFWYYGSFIG